MERDLSVGFYFYFSIAKFQALFLVEDPFKHVPPSWRRTLIDHLAPLLNGTGTSDAISIPGIAGAFCTPGLDKCWDTSGMMHILGSNSPESLSDLCCVRKLLKMTIKLKTYIETRNSHGTNAGSHGSSDPKIQAWIWYGVFKEGDDHMISYDHFPRINIAMMNATNGCRWSFVTQFLFNQLGIKLSYLNWISLARIPSFENCVLDLWFDNSCKYSGVLRPRCWYGLPWFSWYILKFLYRDKCLIPRHEKLGSLHAVLPAGGAACRSHRKVIEMLVSNTDGVPVAWTE